jgi:hypothetical protein
VIMGAARVASAPCSAVSHEEPSLFDALKMIRPSLPRTNLHPELPIVVVDGITTADGMTALRILSATDVVSVRRLNASAATQRYGLNQMQRRTRIRHVARGANGPRDADWKQHSLREAE